MLEQWNRATVYQRTIAKAANVLAGRRCSDATLMTFAEILYAVTGGFGWLIIGLAIIALSLLSSATREPPTKSSAHRVGEVCGRRSAKTS